MKLYLKQRVFSIGDHFTVYDENSEPRFTFEGEIFTFGKKFHLLDKDGAELAYIEQKLFSFFPTYHIFHEEQQRATVIKEFTFLRQAYTIEGPWWTVTGDFFNHEYAITCGEQPVAEVSREWFTWGDAYRINISDDLLPGEIITALCAVLVIDACLDNN